MSRFGVRSSDARLQRPELLSRSREVVQISEVLQTAEGSNPVGELRGHGITAMRGNRYLRFFEEHGYVMTLLAIQPRTMYVQGLARTWNRRDKYDYFQQETAHIGQQEILNKELYAAHASPNGTFGFKIVMTNIVDRNLASLASLERLLSTSGTKRAFSDRHLRLILISLHRILQSATLLYLRRMSST